MDFDNIVIKGKAKLKIIIILLLIDNECFPFHLSNFYLEQKNVSQYLTVGENNFMIKYL